MIIVDCSKGIEGALKVYKSKVRNTKQVELLRERESFTKKSVKERIQKLKAIYINKGMKTESKTYTITLKTICGKETTNTIQAETPKEALLSMINRNPQYAKIKSKKPKL